MNARERKTLQELLEAGEALHRADGEAGMRDVWRQRWEHHQKALAAARKVVPARTITPSPAGATP